MSYISSSGHEDSNAPSPSKRASAKGFKHNAREETSKARRFQDGHRLSLCDLFAGFNDERCHMADSSEETVLHLNSVHYSDISWYSSIAF